MDNNEDLTAYLLPLPEGSVRVPLTEAEADSMALCGEDGELSPEPFVNGDDGKPVCRAGVGGGLHPLYMVTWELPEGTTLGDGTDLSAARLTTLECGTEPAMTLGPMSILATSGGEIRIVDDPLALASAIGEALDEVSEGTRAHAPLAEQARAAYAACERDDERLGTEGERESLGDIDLRDGDIPY